jgi:hypothetical protein
MASEGFSAQISWRKLGDKTNREAALRRDFRIGVFQVKWRGSLAKIEKDNRKEGRAKSEGKGPERQACRPIVQEAIDEKGCQEGEPETRHGGILGRDWSNASPMPGGSIPNQMKRPPFPAALSLPSKRD